MAASPVTAPDEHTATTAHAPARASGWSLFWAGMGFALLLLAAGLLTWFFIGRGVGDFQDAEAKRADFRRKTLADRQTEDHKLLYDAPTWQDKAKGVARVPIDQAVTLTIAELKQIQPHAAYPLTQSPPQPAAAPTSPDKGGGTSAPGNGAVNPPASNPTLSGSPAPTAAPGAAAASPVPANTPPAATPAPPVPTPTAAPATPTPAPAATAPSAFTPPANNAHNPGTPPVPGTAVQPPAPTATPAAPLPAAASTPETAPSPAMQPTPAASGDSTPSPTGPGTSPTGTP